MFKKFLIPVLISVSLVAVCDPVPLLADFSLENWQIVREISSTAVSTPTYVRVKLDNKVAASGRDFRDVRILENDSREVPYQLVVEDETFRNSYLEATVLDRVTDSTGRLMFIIDLTRGGLLHSRLNVVANSPNYRRQVSVYAANALLPHNALGWNLLTDKGYIFKFTDPVTKFTTAQGYVDYPESSARYLRVVVESGPEGVLNFGRAEVQSYEVSSAKLEETAVTAIISQKSETQTTLLVADLGASGIPTRKLRLSTEGGDSFNFNRSASVAGSNDRENWQSVGQGYLSRIVTPKFTGSNLSIEYPESSYRFYKVSIANHDDAPLPLASNVTFTQVVRAVVFEAESGKNYSLYYGNPKAFAPTYDLSRFFNYLDTTQLPEATLGAPEENPSYIPPAPPVVPFTERNKVLLNITLALLVLIIAGLIFLYIWKYMKNQRNKVSMNSKFDNLPPR